ncbi:EF-hand calcium-binding domain-containing protein 11 isoform X2 [Marmota marmota marmota]|uniref:EF-hand calcium binding domain 11 n=1 Tax=Marmota marmota marmota TaxID=9994 RepID=A0A8C6A3V3_MARMA|nr:EF-hand calcium-binding domain-containing protein 11 isoform X2 [Marmota marmota marmota]
MGGDVGVARRSSRAAVGVAEGGSEPGSGGRGSGLGGPELVVAVAMFCSEAGARRRTWEASPAEHKKFVEVFKACDEDNKGYLSREDFKVAFVMLFGYKPSKIEADSVMSSKNSSTSGVSLEEFLNIIRKKKEVQLYHNEIRHIFTAFDMHYRGFLTLEDFQRAFRLVAPKLPERTVLEVFREVDQDSDGLVSFRDFEYAMKNGQNEAQPSRSTFGNSGESYKL